MISSGPLEGTNHKIKTMALLEIVWAARRPLKAERPLFFRA
jgi:hypothetical protein